MTGIIAFIIGLKSYVSLKAQGEGKKDSTGL
jgi:hypothetical protein